jgi:outer membrane protein OmpA-like peptidoglycan-associated protein
MKTILLTAVFILTYASSNVAFTQWRSFDDKIKKQVEKKTQDKIQKEIDNVFDMSYDKTKKSKSNNSEVASTNNIKAEKSEQKSITQDNNPPLTATSKYDFITGEKVIAIEDFMQDEIGDFPAKWNTSSGGEVVTLSGRPGRWLQVAEKGAFLPDFISNLPENFTLEFDLACSQPFSVYSSPFWMGFVQLKNPKTDFARWRGFSDGQEGNTFSFHPKSTEVGFGYAGYKTVQGGMQVLSNKVNQKAFTEKSNPVVHISVWRQKERIRIYMNQEKVWDLPKGYDSKYGHVVFFLSSYDNQNDKYFISNIKLAVGAPDTRNKLLTVGKFTTSGILFDVNSDKVKPDSHGVIKSIADILNENPEVKIKVIGHTDSDGDTAKNLELSKKRAMSVKNYLVSVFGLQGSRIETDGKGASEPVDTNTTKEGKANNRRVEFIKL